MTRRRALRLAILALVLGFLTTWAVAWGAALVPIPMKTHLTFVAGENLKSHASSVYRQLFVAENHTGTVLSKSEYEVVLKVRASQRTAPLSVRHECFKWGSHTSDWERLGFVESAALLKIMSAADIRIYSYGEQATGWPLLSAWQWSALPSGKRVEGGIKVPGGLKRPVAAPPFHALPYLPIYRGLVINTIFYALLWLPVLFLSTHTTRALRRRARTRRGRCPNCNYDLTGLASSHCPECGPPPTPPGDSIPRL